MPNSETVNNSNNYKEPWQVKSQRKKGGKKTATKIGCPSSFEVLRVTKRITEVEGGKEMRLWKARDQENDEDDSRGYTGGRMYCEVTEHMFQLIKPPEYCY